jgi:hypothetical protein
VDCLECFEAAQPRERELNLRPFAAGLVNAGRVSASQMAIVLVVLATVTFDGFTATPAWAAFQTTATPVFEALGTHVGTAVHSLGLAVLIVVFFTIYLTVTSMMSLSAAADLSAVHVGRRFAMTLVPIALAYHLAHYFLFLFTQGQWVVPVASDPLGRGWDLLGTADVVPNIGLINVRYAWLFAVGAIVSGHVVAVYLAHVRAARVFWSPKAALASQYPMLILMVAYTMSSLWILAQPITGGD